MKKKLIGIFLCMLMISTVLPVSGNIEIDVNVIQVSLGNTFYVGGSGPNNFTKIQDAVDNASNGDTVFVYDDSSPYYERVQISTSINLTGEDRETTIVDAYGGGDVIFISCDNVRIFEFTLQNGSYGIRIDRYFGFCIISDNIIKDNSRGIYIWNSDRNIIEGNTFYNNEEETIVGFSSNDNVITGNSIDQPTGSYNPHGVGFGTSTGNNISGNTINNCETGVKLFRSDNNSVLNNVISSGSLGIDINDDCSNNRIIGNNISYYEYGGIEITENSNDNIIYHNNLEYNYENAIDEGNNTWDDGEYGNYWSDYEDKYPDAKKIKKEGIWDTPYEIPEGDNKDMCPLINLWPDPVSKPSLKNENRWFHTLSGRLPFLQIMFSVVSRFYNTYLNMKGGLSK